MNPATPLPENKKAAANADYAGALGGLAIRSAYLKGEWIKQAGRDELDAILAEGRRIVGQMEEKGVPLTRRSDNPFVRGWSRVIHPGPLSAPEANVWSAARQAVQEAFKDSPKKGVYCDRAYTALKEFQELRRPESAHAHGHDHGHSHSHSH